MKILYLDCAMGAAGDMLAAALLGLMDSPREILKELNCMGIPQVRFALEDSVKCGVSGLHLTVTAGGAEEGTELHPHHHEHRNMKEIIGIIDGLNVSEKVKHDAKEIYKLIAEAESKVHGEPVTEIHFHEVGMLDAIADITAVCWLMEKLAPERICASAVHVGSGTVRCAHGVLPVPAPAAAELLRGIPAYGGEIRGELCTPTGAALLRYFVQEYGSMPVMTAEKIGYGMGKKDFERPNCVRATLGEGSAGAVCEFFCNLDDMTGEEIGFALELLMEQGALDVYTIPVGMKKSRPGIILGVMCRRADREKILALIFRHTTTLGVRETVSTRTVLRRQMAEEQTEFGTVRRKTASGFGAERSKYEYEDLAEIARKTGMSLREIREMIKSE